MSGQPGSKSTTLRGPNFDDDVELEFLSPSTNLKTWKIIKKSSIRKAQYQDKILQKVFYTGITLKKLQVNTNCAMLFNC